MKLELKHLAPYLPYGLKCKSTTILFGEEDNGVYEMGLISMRGVLKGTGKPILRPLSDLTKEDVALITEYSDIENVAYNGNPSNLYFTNTEEKTFLEDYVDSLNYLYSRHFDVFGLIEAGLAIDINTLSNEN
jgi:hypothetical protein|tara:strand:+ start:101 stop:496 length:396 start_codon:yes stop_codon:yes gene_type:complete